VGLRACRDPTIKAIERGATVKEDTASEHKLCGDGIGIGDKTTVETVETRLRANIVRRE
jgi:hypothetical protein